MSKKIPRNLNSDKLSADGEAGKWGLTQLAREPRAKQAPMLVLFTYSAQKVAEAEEVEQENGVEMAMSS